MSVLLLLGLIGMAFVWFAGLYGLAWSWRRSVLAFEAADVDIPDGLRTLSATEVMGLNVRRHTIGWSVFFFSCFLALAVIDLPIWAGLGMALVLGVHYGSVQVTDEREQEARAVRPPIFSEEIDNVGYTAVAATEWFGYLGVLVFAAQIVSEAFS